MPRRAIACAFALKAEFERWNAKRNARQADPISVAIGVHFGPVVVGNVGAKQRIEFTVLGDVVNVASRLEKATRELGCVIAASDECVRAAAEAEHLSSFDRSVHLQVRGRSSPLVVHVAGRAERCVASA
jgi:adenylate cyclase